MGGVHAAHVVPHEVTDVESSLTQVPAQLCVPAKQTHSLATQCFPAGQTKDSAAVLHPPQFSESFRMSASHPFAVTPSQL
jgi:hypothetical protein